MNFQPSHPLPYMLQLLPSFLLLPQQKLICNIEFIFFSYKLLTKFFLRKDNFRKQFCKITIIVNIFRTFYAFFVHFSLCSLLLWQKSILIYKYINISIIMIIIIMVIKLVILNYVNKMLLDYINNNWKNFTILMKYIDFLMFFFYQRAA